MKQKSLVSLMVFLVTFGLSVVARAQDKPLSKDQVFALVHNQMADDSGAKIVEQRGIDFEPGEDYLTSLKKAGASDAFLQALRAAHKPKPTAAGQASQKALSQVQILALLAGDVPSSRVAMLVAERGIDFQPTEDYLKTLEGSGAEPDLLGALRAAKPPQAPLTTAANQSPQVSATNDAVQTEVQQHLTRGLQFRKKGQFPEAELEYRAASDLDPKNPDLWVSLSTVLYHEHKPDDALAAAHRALQLNPALDHAHVAAGNVLGSNGDYDGAAAEFREAARLNPSNAIAYENLGIALTRKGDLDGAVTALRESLRLNPRSDHAHLDLGLALRKNGDLETAIAQFRDAVRINPNNDLAHMNLGSALAQNGHLKLALEQYRIGCELKPDNQVYRQAFLKLQQRMAQ